MYYKRTYRGLDADTDYFMVGAQLVQLLPEARNQAMEKTRNNRIARLRTNEEKVEYERNLRGKLEAITKKCNKETKKEKKEWFDEECKRELQSRKKLRLKILQEGMEEAKNKFEEQRRKTKMMLRNNKIKHYEKEQYNKNRRDYRNNDIRNFYQGVKNERKGYQPKPVFYKDKDGKIIAADDEVLERWKGYFKQLLNGDEINQAYDKVQRRELYKILDELIISKKLRRMIRLTLQKTQNRVKLNNQMSEEFEVRNGVRQGGPVSSVFSLVLEKVIRDAEINRSGLLYYKRHQCLAFADDLVILARNKKELKEVIKRLEEQSRTTEASVLTKKKAKYMEWTEQEYQEGRFFKVETNTGRKYEFKEVEQFIFYIQYICPKFDPHHWDLGNGAIFGGL
ncbi:hypothetical protein NQ315_013766 [Exocentrus adspersus]|uniref:Reverse transcriptase domain-containing protein n=1 Tax=Exocentrus adspersus TaxID=1586481 RepID=A0AAV8W567_9CUCU|nr:hypothetical protein NQ315_013766 [Exocentrus adspersus]